MKIEQEKITYKPLDIESIPLLLEIQEETFEFAQANNVDPDFLRRNTYETLAVCFGGQSLVLGAYYENELIAFGILYVAGKTDENLAKDIDGVQDVTTNANVKLTIVRPDYRGNSLQYELISRLEAHAAEQGFSWLSSTVSPANPWSQHNLKRCGFEVHKILKKYGGMQRILFVKKIG